ncbi:MAG: TrmB family transcriptional regulator [Candidatus Thermoplasmatota archaeon]|nr:TrmB family transcriptional regulator [Candidatus Thermoplasmatota archaeon]
MDLKATIARLGGNADELMAEYFKISGALSKLGLSDYESRAYIALVALGPSSANFVADVAQIPRTSSYKVMISLSEKGFIQSKQGRPRIFSPISPSELSERFIAEIKESFSKIDSVRNILSDKGVPQLVYTILGKSRVLDKIGEMIDKAEHTFIISSPSFPAIRRRLGKRFGSAVSRGVHVKVITTPFVKAPKDIEVVRRDGLIATDVISDGKAALLAAADLSACGYTDNESLAAHLEEFLRIMSDRQP